MTYKCLTKELIAKDNNSHANDNSHIQIKDAIYEFIDYVRSDGSRWAFPYRFLLCVNYRAEHNAQFITIKYSSAKVTLKGFHLKDLYGDIFRSKVSIIVQTNDDDNDTENYNINSTSTPEIWDINVVEG